MPRVNPEILVWARETAGLSPQEGAKAIDLNDARGRTGAERLSALERGDEEPSRPLLLKMAQKYRRPLLTFFLDKVPRKGDRGQDFRTVPGAGLPAYDATVDALIRDINTRQSLVRSLLEDEEALPLPFIASANINQGAESVASAIRETLLLNIDEFRWQDSVESAFKHLRSRIEASGIFVLLIGNLGSHHTNISPEVFRGFAVADPIAPLVVINDQDARTAWSFTALHEIAHLWLGATGISGASMEARIETFCNEVAGRILLPGDEIQILAGIGDAPIDEAIEHISLFAEERRLSRSMVAYCLLRANIVSMPQWQALKDHFYQEWLDHKARKREKQKAAKSGPNYYVVKRDRLGSALLNLVDRSLTEGAITYTKAGKVLGVKPRNVVPLLRDIPLRGGL
jgi:Zn-dependent peptidase ImmA (M78 family)/transcriptional regulator with XRE-family HTH domain